MYPYRHAESRVCVCLQGQDPYTIDRGLIENCLGGQPDGRYLAISSLLVFRSRQWGFFGIKRNGDNLSLSFVWIFIVVLYNYFTLQRIFHPVTLSAAKQLRLVDNMYFVFLFISICFPLMDGGLPMDMVGRWFIEVGRPKNATSSCRTKPEPSHPILAFLITKLGKY